MTPAPWDQPPNIALIDPDLSGYRSVQTALADRFRFICATTSEAALRLTSGVPIWLWVVAAQLPDLPGSEFCRLLRTRDPSARLIAVGDNSTSADEIACRAAGVPFYFGRPLDPRLFMTLIDQLTQAGLRQARRTSPPAVARGEYSPSLSRL